MTTLLDIRDLSLSIRTPEGEARILDRVSLRLRRGAVLGLVGESGCGKSTLVKTVLGVLPRNARASSGQVIFDGTDLLPLPERDLATRFRGRRIGFIPQDPALALNPMFRVGTQLGEIWRWHAPEGEDRGAATARARILSLFRRVQLPDAEAALDRYPHQFSGGQRQRVLIAAALLCRPELIVADEPTTALDVTTQQQILLLIRSLAQEMDLSVLFVTHDFGVVSALCSDVAVMYAGQMVEAGAKRLVLGDPCHPYTRALIACHPDRMERLAGIPGAVPSPLSPPAGCRFRPRCDLAEDACAARAPGLSPQSDGRGVGCIRWDA